MARIYLPARAKWARDIGGKPANFRAAELAIGIYRQWLINFGNETYKDGHFLYFLTMDHDDAWDFIHQNDLPLYVPEGDSAVFVMVSTSKARCCAGLIHSKFVTSDGLPFQLTANVFVRAVDWS